MSAARRDGVTPSDSTTGTTTGTGATPPPKLTRLFDLRWVIAGLLNLYGVVLIIRGFFDGAAELQRAAGVRVNLWTGIGLLLVGLLFTLWAALRPLQPPSPAEQDEARRAGQLPDAPG